jgi:hypothetical protein
MAIKTFTTGEVLTSSDTNTYLANSGLVFVKSQTVGTGVSSVTVSSAFSADYDSYRIVYNGGVASAAVSIRTQIGGSTAAYYAALNYVVYASGATPVSASTNNQASWEFTGYGTSNYATVSYDLIGPFLSKYTAFHAVGWVAETAAGTASGLHQVAASYTSFTLIPNSGTLTGGTITVYGYRKG